MNNVPLKLREELASDPEYKHCMRRLRFRDHYCEGTITWEHALTYGNRQIQEKFAIISLCEKAHSVGQFQDRGILDKRKNQYIAAARASEEDMKKYPRLNWRALRRTYNK